MRTPGEQLRYTMRHTVYGPKASQGGWHAHGSNIPGLYRLFFYSFDCHEPPHVHVRRERVTCKFWLAPVALRTNHGFSPRGLNRRTLGIILEHLEHI